MNPLTADEMADVAREILQGTTVEVVGGRVILGDDWDSRWWPNFKGSSHRRSQALAVVEWLFATIWKRYAAYNDLGKDWLLDQLAEVGHAVKDKDINALMGMVLKLRNPQ